MNSGWKIARIRGIDLRIHISLFLLMAYLVFVVSARFQDVASEAKISVTDLPWGPFAWGIIVAVALFVSVALHELGHAFVAQAQGVKVKGITLMMLGGVSQMEKIPEARYSEFKLSVVGPIVSLLIAAVLWLVNVSTDNPTISFFSYWVGGANLMLGIFNLLPAFPLDGGRALRSLLAARQGMVRATQSSVRVSRILAWTLGIIGLLGFNVLLMLIAFFIYHAAQTELFFLLSKSVLEGMKTRDVMVKMPPIRDYQTVGHAVNAMIETRSTVLPVVAKDEKPHLVSFPQIRRVPRDFWQTTLVRDVMILAPRVLDANDPVGEVLNDLAGSPMRTLPVAENGDIVGYLRFQDVSQMLQLRSLMLEPDQKRPEKVDRAA